MFITERVGTFSRQRSFPLFHSSQTWLGVEFQPQVRASSSTQLCTPTKQAFHAATPLSLPLPFCRTHRRLGANRTSHTTEIAQPQSLVKAQLQHFRENALARPHALSEGQVPLHHVTRNATICKVENLGNIFCSP